MRAAISIIGVFAAVLLVGACFDPTRPCSTNADCVNGGTCDPGTKTCVSGVNPNDKVPPAFSIAVAPPGPRQNTSKLTELDPGSPDGGVDAFRRDETVQVTVTSADSDVDAGSVQLVAYGLSGNPGTAIVAALVPCIPGSQGASAPFCRQAAVALAPLPFEAFRGVIALEVSGSDLSNNVGKADAGVNVTRWKWRYSAGAPIYTTPAIADDGTVVFATNEGPSGSLFAISPDGSERWAPVSIGPVKASPVVGALDGGRQFVYVGTASAAAQLFAFDTRDGTTVSVCPSSGGYGGPFIGTPAVVVSGTQSFEGALALANSAKLVNIRPLASAADGPCLVSDVTSSQAFPSSVVAQGADAFVGTIEGSVRAYRLLSGNWVANSAWGTGLGYVPVGTRGISGLAITDVLIGTTSIKGVFSLDIADGSFRGSFPDGGLSDDPGGVAVSGAEIFFGGATGVGPELFAVSKDLNRGTGYSVAESPVGSPIIGVGGQVYLATAGGTLESRQESTATHWAVSFGASEGFLASPTLDCGARDGGLAIPTSSGALYLSSVTGNLYGLIVDSPGLDATAPWPKYQHDIRNTGNPTTPIQSCP